MVIYASRPARATGHPKQPAAARTKKILKKSKKVLDKGWQVW